MSGRTSFEVTDLIAYVPEARLNQHKQKRNRIDDSSSSVSESSCSEKSYKPSYTSESIIETIAYLNFYLTWVMITVLANSIVFLLRSYAMVFDGLLGKKMDLVIINVVCYAIHTVDTVALLVNYTGSDVRMRIAYKRIPIGYIIIHCLTMLGAVGFCIPHYGNIVLLISEILRFYKIYFYIVLMRLLPGYNTFGNLVRKYLVILLLVTHGFACVWMLLGCFKSDEECDARHRGPRSYWTWIFPLGLRQASLQDIQISLQYYIVCVFYVNGGLTSVGHGGASFRNNLEMIVILLAIGAYLLIFCGMFIADFINWQIEQMAFDHKMMKRMVAINRDLDRTEIPIHLRKKILKYYFDFRTVDGGVKAARVQNVLPREICNEIILEVYWYFVNKCHIFKNTAEAFRRAIVLNMHCEMYNRGDVLYDLCQKADMMCYIARGTIQILSGNDGESPILTLGPGTCIGQMYLLYSFKIRTKIVVPTYTTIYFLKRKELWKIVAHMYKLKQGPILHQNFKNKIMIAKTRLEMDATISRRVERKWRCTESKKILSDFKEHVDREMNEIQQQEHLHKNMDELLLDHMYVYSKLYDVRAYDTVFFHTKWPWVLHPHTQLLRIWECIVVLVLIYVALWYPYIISCRGPDEVHNLIFNDLISVIFIFDIVIQIFTATETKSDVHWRSSEVMLAGLEKFSFTLDVIAALPVHLLVAFTGQNRKAKKILAILSYNKLAKLYKMNDMFSYIERMFEKHILFVRLIKYAVYLLYSAHFMGSLHLLVACFDINQCAEYSWVQKLRYLFSLYKGYEPKYDPINLLYLHGFTQVFFMITTTSTVVVSTRMEVIITICLAFYGASLLSYIIAEYAASIILETKSMLNHGDSIKATVKYMQDNQIPKYLQGRILYSLKAVKDFNLEDERNLYFDCPSHLFRQQKIAKYKQYIQRAPMFQNFDEDNIELIASRCTELHLAPQEYLNYSGVSARSMYIIVKGYCAVIKGSNLKHLLGPSTCISALEIVFGVRHVLTIQAVTHVILTRISRKETDLILAKNPAIKQQITQSLDEMTYIRLFTSFEDFFAPESFKVEEEKRSWFVFKRLQGDPLDLDYRAVYRRSKFAIIRYFLLRRTILPNGRFLFIWEIFRAFFAFLIGMLGPPYIVHSHYWPSLQYILWFLSFTTLVDIYIRFHVSYYNEQGILVTHPLCTAKYYLTHAFIIDVLGLLPISVFKVRFDYDKYTVLLLDFNVLFQMYRFPQTILNYTRKHYGRNSVFMQAVKCIPVTLIICNALTCILMYITTNVVSEGGNRYLEINDFSWINVRQHNLPIEQKVSWNFYYISFYCTLTYMFGVGFNKFQPSTAEEMYYFIICLTVGYIFNAYNLVCVIHSRFMINQKLSRYQNNIRQLQRYMKMENLSKATQKNVINYFEHFWRMTAGVKLEEILSKCHVPLRVDFVLSMYESTFRRVPIFFDADMHFYRRIALIVHVLHLRKGSVFTRLNDIVRYTYIVHKGEVVVHDPIGTLCAVLEPGSMFGNIDDIVCTRSMVQYTINATTDLIYIETTKLYDVIRDFPDIYRRINHHILLNNLSYVAENTKVFLSDDLENSQKRLVNPLLRLAAKKYFFILMVIAPLVSCIIASYQLGFYKNNFIIDVFLYIFDVLHIIKVILHFYVPYYDSRGDMVIDRRLIRKRYMKPMKFYFDCLTLLPYQLLCLLAPKDQVLKYRRLLGSFRIVRAFNVYKYFDLSANQLYANHVLIRFISILVNTIMILHLGACTMYFYACPFRECTVDTWIYSSEIRHRCQDPYTCSLFYMLSILTSTGFERHRPASLLDMLFCMVTILLSKYIVGSFIGDICSLFRNSTLAILRYDFQVKILKAYLNNHLVSKPFLEKIDAYCKYLWVHGDGQQIPSLFLESPNFLIGEVKVEAYGKHLFTNEVFSKCHKDFLRVLIRKLKLQTFFCGDMICQQEDTNNTMYFIHRGRVNVYSILGEEEIHVDELQELDCFGIIQGIYPHTPHTHTYRANTVCIILMLVYDDWYKFLTFFPSAKLELSTVLTRFN